jgi:hypothetical protein
MNYQNLEFDPTLTSSDHNCKRSKRFPYAVVINAETSGIFIPEKNLIRSEWNDPNPNIIQKDLPGGIETGLFLTNTRMIILASVQPYIKNKNSSVNPEVDRGNILGWYSDQTKIFNKEFMDAAGEYLIGFLDDSNNLLNRIPIKIRFRNVALWSLIEFLEKYYSEAELSFAKITNQTPSSKSDRWRAFCIIEAEFIAIKEGVGTKRSYCCKIGNYKRPTVENFPELFLGVNGKSEAIKDIYSLISDFGYHILEKINPVF